MTRRIVYISTTAAPIDVGGFNYTHITALCSDGSVWQHIKGGRGWTELPPIPQPSAFEDSDAPAVAHDFGDVVL